MGFLEEVLRYGDQHAKGVVLALLALLMAGGAGGGLYIANLQTILAERDKLLEQRVQLVEQRLVARQFTVERPAREAAAKTQTELSLPEKVTIACAVRHVPLSGLLYLVGMIGSTFIAGATVSRLPSVRSLLSVFREDRLSQSALTPSYLDERIRKAAVPAW